mmetsp:Transcript_13793/g.27440  ORF Transcript_13793/g.27440 Transcript_13793/m.27440 type:complete len:151 (-) Transcript_13793:1138-1590(-)
MQSPFFLSSHDVTIACDICSTLGCCFTVPHFFLSQNLERSTEKSGKCRERKNHETLMCYSSFPECQTHATADTQREDRKKEGDLKDRPVNGSGPSVNQSTNQREEGACRAERECDPRFSLSPPSPAALSVSVCACACTYPVTRGISMDLA